jgi:hypothetical protein
MTRRVWLRLSVAGLLLAMLLGLLAVAADHHTPIGNPEPGPNSTVMTTS